MDKKRKKAFNNVSKRTGTVEWGKRSVAVIKEQD
jgi:hypothetical protein